MGISAAVANSDSYTNDLHTVGSKTVAMFENFGLGGVWHLGAWDSCLVLRELNKVFHLGFQMSYR